MKLLVLDDEPWNMSWIEDFAEAEGAELRMVSTYDEAVEAVKQDPPDVAVVDVMIGMVEDEPPGATLSSVPEEWVGLRFVRYLRTDAARTKDKTEIIVFTVLDRAELRKVVEDAYQGVYCTKSDVQRFRGVLAAYIRYSRKR